MGKRGSPLWPYGTRAALVSAPLIFFALLALVALARQVGVGPRYEADQAFLLGAFVLALAPLGLAIIDTLAERGAVLEYGGAKLDFSRVAGSALPTVTVPGNIGVPGEPVSDSSTSRILESLRNAVSTDIVVIDLESGEAWWETRLLVLLAGAVRLHRPEVMVFLATDRALTRRFQGWARPHDLLPCLLKADARFRESYLAALAAARQWELIPPPVPPPPSARPWMEGLAVAHPWMAFDGATGLPNELAAEQFLATDLGAKIEQQARPSGISLTRLEELFRPVLHVDVVDETWSAEAKLRAFLGSAAEYVAVTRTGAYQSLLSRATGLSAVVASLTEAGPKT